MKHWVVGLFSDIRNVLLITATAIASALLGYYWIGRTDPREELIAAAATLEYRVADARIADWPYRPRQGVRRGADDGEADGRSSLSILAASTSIRRATRDPHLIGLSLFLNREWEAAATSLDDALSRETQREELSRAIAASTNATLLSDLAAAHYALGAAKARRYEFIIATEAIERAWRLEQTPEIAWNRALCIEALSLHGQAIEAWSDSIALDGESKWANEARGRRQSLKQPAAMQRWENARPKLEDAVRRNNRSIVESIVNWYPGEARNDAERMYLPRWGQSVVAGAPDEHSLAVCRAVARVLRGVYGETLLYDTVAQIDAAGPSQRAAIAHGLALFALALEPYHRDFRVTIASERFRDAIEELQRARSPFAQLPQMLLLNARRVMYPDEVLVTTTELLTRSSPYVLGHRALEAQLLWVRALTHGRNGQPQAAIRDYKRALEIFEELRDSERIAKMHELLSEPYAYIGDSGTAWRHLFLALDSYRGEASPQLLELARLAGVAALKADFTSVALLFLDAHVGATDDPALADLAFQAFLWRSLAHRAEGDATAATRDVHLARTYATIIPDGGLRADALNDVEMVVDRMSQTQDPQKRLEILEDAIHFAEKKDFRFRLSQLYREEALEHIRMRRWDEAERSLFKAIGQFEQERATIAEEEQRSAFVESRRSAYRTLASLLCRRGDFAGALDVVERGRARTLFDQMARRGASPRKPAPVAELRPMLASDTALIVFGGVDEGIGVWVVSASDVRYVPLAIPPEDLERLATRFRMALREDDQKEALEVSRALHAAIVRPWQALARDFARLVIVADGAVSSIPFAGLNDRSTGEFLMQQHVLSIAPSVNVYVACSARTRTLVNAQLAALVVAPATIATEDGEQVPLSASRAEATFIARQYPGAFLLDGERARREDFVLRARSAALIHFAGHTQRAPAAVPHLAFAAGEAMHAEDIRVLQLEATRLVVLAACDSGSERFANEAQGTSSLARAFLAAGVPAVVASYWNVEDEAAARLSRQFHAYLARGEDPAAALRHAQLQLLTSPDARSRNVSSWAAFAVIGETNRERR